MRYTVTNFQDVLANFFFIKTPKYCIYFNRDRIPHNVLDSRQRGQLYTALKNAFSTILKFLHELSMSQSKLNSNDPKVKVITCMISCRFLHIVFLCKLPKNHLASSYKLTPVFVTFSILFALQYDFWAHGWPKKH